MAAKTSYIKNHILAKYEGLKIDSHASPSKKIWQRFRFGSKTEELGVIRGKLITYTCTISILIDTLQIHAADRVEGKIDGGFAEIASQFEKIRKEIFQIASHARAEERRGATMSSLSLSTYAGDDKVVWQDFRRELLKKGFRSQSLEKYKNVLQAYMLKLDQSGLLDQPNISTSDQTSGTPWWVTRMYMETINSLADLELNDHPPSTIGDSPSGYNTRSPASFESNRAELTGGGTAIGHIQVPSGMIEQPRPNMIEDLSVEMSSNKLTDDTDLASISSLDWGSDSGSINEESPKYDISEPRNGLPLKPKPSAMMISCGDAHEKLTRTPRSLALEWSQKEKIDRPKGKPRGPASEDKDLHENPDDLPLNRPTVRAQLSDGVTYPLPNQLENFKEGSSLQAEITKNMTNMDDKDTRRNPDSSPESPLRPPTGGPEDYWDIVPAVIPTEVGVAINPHYKLGPVATSSVTERTRRPYFDDVRAAAVRDSLVSGGTGHRWRMVVKTWPEGILKRPTEKFPEDPAPFIEGVAALNSARKDGIPPDARWTKISRRMVNPEALDLRWERYVAREDFVIVLRVLKKEEVRGYTEATQIIRARRADPSISTESVFSKLPASAPSGFKSNRFDFYENYVEHYASWSY